MRLHIAVGDDGPNEPDLYQRYPTDETDCLAWRTVDETSLIFASKWLWLLCKPTFNSKFFYTLYFYNCTMMDY